MLHQKHQQMLQKQQQQQQGSSRKRRRPSSQSQSKPQSQPQSQSPHPHNYPVPAPAPKIRGVPASLTPLLVAAIKSSRPPPSSSSSLAPNAAPPSSSRDVSHVLSLSADGHGRTGSSGSGKGDDAANGLDCESGELSDFVSSCAGRHGDQPEVHVACLDFCLDLALDGEASAKLRLRRGALAVARGLLLRSRACRERLCGGSGGGGVGGDGGGGDGGGGGGDSMRRLVRCLSTLRGGGDHDRAVGESQADGLRREGVELLTTLADEFGDLYPKFVVALRYLEEKRGVVNAFTVTANNASASGSRPNRAARHTTEAERDRVGGGLTVYALRVARDAALEHGDKEARLVRSLVRKVDRYCEALVPRMFDFGVPGAAVAAEKSPTAVQLRGGEGDKEQDADDGGGGEDGDEDVQWEDGEGDFEEGTTTADHEAAVERTLAAMGLLQTGGGDYSVMVDFDGGAGFGGNSAEDTRASTTVVAVERNERDYDSDSDSYQNKGAGSKDEGDEEAEGGDFFFDPTGGGAENATSAANRDGDEKTKVRSQLQKCAQALSSRHLPRLTLWIEALLSADDQPVLRENDEDVGGGEGGEGNVDSGNGKVGRGRARLSADGSSRRRARGQMARKLMEVRAAASGCVATASKLDSTSTSNSAHSSGCGGGGGDATSSRVRQTSTGGGGQLCTATVAAASSSSSWREAVGITNSGGGVRSRLATNGATRTRQVTRSGGGAIKRATRLKIKAYST